MNRAFSFAILFAFVINFQVQSQIPAKDVFQKIGYTNIDFVLGKLPEAKVVSNQLEVSRAQLEKAIDETIKEFQLKAETYQKSGGQMTDVIRADKEKELESLQERIQQMRTNAQQSLQTKQQQMLSPLLNKVNNAINEVGKEHAYVYIFNLDAGAGTTPFILFAATQENNVTNLVLKKLGVDPDKDLTPQTESKPAAPQVVTTPVASKPSAPKKN